MSKEKKYCKVEKLREKGQFWTPDWIAEAMASYMLVTGKHLIFDPGVGAGAFFRAARTVFSEADERVEVVGTEIDPKKLEEALQHGTLKEDIDRVRIADFLLAPMKRPFESIIANPPYVRHHRLSKNVKKRLSRLASSIIGKQLDARAGYHIYFLIRALDLLADGGTLAFIIPSDTCEGKFANTLWNWITKKYRLDAVITFTPKASPFPKLDTNPLIVLIRKLEPKDEFFWVRCNKAETRELRNWIVSGFSYKSGRDLEIIKRKIREGLHTGLSRPPPDMFSGESVLGDFATVLRGIATGANEFFFLTEEEAKKLKLPKEFLIPAIGRTRDVPSNEITNELLKKLEKNKRPTLLLSLDGRPIDQFPGSIRNYLRKGEELGLDKRSLISTRKPWYKMETRKIPPLLFAYLGRRNARFIKNKAGIVPLTGFLCIYPKSNDPEFVDKLFSMLNNPKTLENLWRVGKSYGGGAIKVEPRSLERLPISDTIIRKAGLKLPEKVKTLDMFF